MKINLYKGLIRNELAFEFLDQFSQDEMKQIFSAVSILLKNVSIIYDLTQKKIFLKPLETKGIFSTSYFIKLPKEAFENLSKIIPNISELFDTQQEQNTRILTIKNKYHVKFQGKNTFFIPDVEVNDPRKFLNIQSENPESNPNNIIINSSEEILPVSEEFSSNSSSIVFVENKELTALNKTRKKAAKVLNKDVSNALEYLRNMCDTILNPEIQSDIFSLNSFYNDHKKTQIIFTEIKTFFKQPIPEQGLATGDSGRDYENIDKLLGKESRLHELNLMQNLPEIFAIWEKIEQFILNDKCKGFSFGNSLFKYARLSETQSEYAEKINLVAQSLYRLQKVLTDIQNGSFDKLDAASQKDRMNEVIKDLTVEPSNENNYKPF